MSSIRSVIAAGLLGLSLLTRVLGDNPINPGFPYGAQKVRGVNLGGWLVLEPWITPSLFDQTGNDAIIDEWTFGQYQDYNTAHSALVNHWNSWITEEDFVQIAAAGLNHVRVPIGYWAFEVGPGEPYIQGQLPYLQRAATWAGNHGLKMIVDLHGAPGSQNGFDNSGQKMDFPHWHSNGTNVARTNAIIKRIADMFKDNANVVTTIAPLNEPAGFDGQDVLDTVRQYWRDSYGNIRYPYGSSRESNTLVLLHDAFQPLDYWNGFLTAPDAQGVAMDTHIYTIFSDQEESMSESQHISTVCGKQSSLSSFDLWVIVGEWTPANTDCAKYLNGRGVGARYDGSYPGSPCVGSCNGKTGAASSFSSSYKTFLRKFWEAQVISYEKGSGWIQWTWKAENADEWSYQAGLANGWIPRDPTDLQYPNICG
ncbi:glycoside hydrolase [Gloeophyllum trabeum ATCC 11539]|uniref:glucan 1,3-beta-glucosidase n=1 Tax=Gloeophyllum trabeum (strain ATCC 11539 / FP-39264 / Madison 617) TaxID=670483 RepID=S7QKU3_GLOTA|nr:glycoside hydrolase [Gloeophyllum trabeum ATCC 11539]EPQ60446.1 glycoside hydrolase [Gloeophyllum trabeum ATCC 11539]